MYNLIKLLEKLSHEGKEAFEKLGDLDFEIKALLMIYKNAPNYLSQITLSTSTDHPQ